MNERGIRDVESALGVAIPQTFRDLVIPADVEGVHLHWLSESSREIIALNEKFRLEGFYGETWLEHLLATGEGEDSEVYFIDLNERPLWMHLAYLDTDPYYTPATYHAECRLWPVSD